MPYEISFREDLVTVSADKEVLGTVGCFQNPCHSGHMYLEPELAVYDPGIWREVFVILRRKFQKPLQVMVSSREEKLTALLKAAGFDCRRKCWEMEVSAGDYRGDLEPTNLLFGTVGSPVYHQCSQRMLERYIATHEAVNPWTGTPEQFFARLPKVVCYAQRNGEIGNLAFVEENEIAYVCGSGAEEFGAFAGKLAAWLFCRYDRICFEADDCDEYAMALKALFAHASDESFDTYILL